MDMLDTTVIIAIVGILSATVGALIWIIKYLFSEFKPALDGLIKSTDQNTLATKSADEYLRERNGRDNEFHKEVMASLQDIPIQARAQADIVAQELKAVGTLTAEKLQMANEAPITQTVAEQVVEHQVVGSTNGEQTPIVQTISEQTVENQVVGNTKNSTKPQE